MNLKHTIIFFTSERNSLDVPPANPLLRCRAWREVPRCSTAAESPLLRWPKSLVDPQSPASNPSHKVPRWSPPGESSSATTDPRWSKSSCRYAPIPRCPTKFPSCDCPGNASWKSHDVVPLLRWSPMKSPPPMTSSSALILEREVHPATLILFCDESGKRKWMWRVQVPWRWCPRGLAGPEPVWSSSAMSPKCKWKCFLRVEFRFVITETKSDFVLCVWVRFEMNIYSSQEWRQCPTTVFCDENVPRRTPCPLLRCRHLKTPSPIFRFDFLSIFFFVSF